MEQKYLVIEIQNNGGTIANIVTAFDDINHAKQQYYLVCSAASVSEVDRHSVSLLNDDGFCIMFDHFEHF